MKTLLLIMALGVSSYAWSQSSYQVGLLPAVNVNTELGNDWKLNGKVESRQELGSGNFNDSNSLQYEYLLTDVSLVAAKKIAIDKSLVGGYLIRIQEKELLHRLIQQFIWVKSFSGMRLAHRVATDQTFQRKGNTEFRLRYRASARFPLNGQTVDPKEFYLKVNHEYLNAWEDSEHDLELRLVPHLGYSFSKTNTLELGLDYRLDSFLDGPPRHRFWTAINWYISI